jgi:hypothetical protein
MGGCSASAGPGVRLTATLVSPVDVELRWAGTDPAAAGQIVEFATEPQGPYTILQFVPPAQTTYRHPDLMPETTFYYRVRPFFGSASAPVDVTLPPGDYSEKDQENDHEWAPPKVIPGAATAKQPTRSAAAAPTELTATVMHANGIRFTWTEHASDEEGYLIEVKPHGGTEFTQAMVMDPDVNSVGLITLPREKAATYRVRPFLYGPQSTVDHQTTGLAP